MRNSFDWMILDRYLADDMRPGDREQLDAWIAGHPSRAGLLKVLTTECNRRSLDAPLWDIDALANRVADRTSPTPIQPRLEKRVWVSRPFADAGNYSGRRQWTRVAGIAATIAVAGTAGFLATHEWRQAPQRSAPAPKMREYATTRGQLASIYLADGTRVVLAPESRLYVAESVADPSRSGNRSTAREVRLEGGAYFDVVHDANSPFSVTTAAGVARDLGTEFEVRAYESGKTAQPMQVTVISGVVSLHRPGSGAQAVATLRRGDRGTLSGTGRFTLVQNVDLGPTLAWTKGSLVFNHTHVSDVVRELSRWYDLDIRLSDEVDPNRRLILTLDNEAAQEAINLVALSLGLRVQQRGRVVTLYK